MPFVTEELWQRVPRPASRPISIALAPYPSENDGRADAEAERSMHAIMEVISAARSVRNEHDLHPSATVPLVLRTEDADLREVLKQQSGLIQFLVRTTGDPLVHSSGSERPDGSVLAVAGSVEVFVVLKGVIDSLKEAERIERVRKKLFKDRASLEQRLSNPKFVEKAPPEVVAEVERQLQEIMRQLAQLEEARELVEELK
jgi:valyl-tRNA synthetase